MALEGLELLRSKSNDLPSPPNSFYGDEEEEEAVKIYPENYTIDHSKRKTYQCIECGKTYKHRNCLSKHVWEHSEEWELTSAFLLTKHQQVQMLEAAAILMTIDKKSHYSPTIHRKKRLLSLQNKDREEEKKEEEEEEEEEEDIQIDMDDL